LEEHRVVEETIESVQCEEEEVHREVEESFDSFCEDWVTRFYPRNAHA
jgi:hypothetical protein